MRTACRRLLCAAVVLATAGAGPAEGQVRRAPREYRGLFGGNRSAPGQSQTSLSLTFTAMGGYDDSVLGSQGSTPGSTPEALSASGYNGVGLTELRFRHGRDERYVEATAGGAVNVYSVTGADTTQNAQAEVRAQLMLGRRTTVRATAGTAYQDYFTLAAIPIVVEPGAEPPSATSADFAVSDRTSWAHRASAELSRGWGRSQTTTVRYLIDRTEYDEPPARDDGVRFVFQGDARSRGATVDHRVALGRRASVAAHYAYRDSRTERPDGTARPFEEQRVEVSGRYERRVSRRRLLSIEAGAGGSLSDTVDELTRAPSEFWSTTGHARTRLDIGRSWAAQASYQRGWELRQGFTAPFFTDTVTASVGGYLGRRIDLVFSGGYATGVLGAGQAVDSRYRSRDASAQARFALTGSAAFIVSYLRYYYEFDRPDLLPPGFRPTNDRQVVRAGLTFWVPLVGSWRQPAGEGAAGAAAER